MFKKVFGILSLSVIATSIFAVGTPVEAQKAGSGKTLIAQAGDVNWATDLNAALTQARGSKYVLADVYTDWCGWCKRLDKDTFANPQMMSYLNSKFICVKVNAENPAGGKAAAQKYKVSGYPCALVFEPSGKLLGKISGYLKPAEYQAALEAMIKNPPADPMAE